jgi:hypothetical protein
MPVPTSKSAMTKLGHQGAWKKLGWMLKLVIRWFLRTISRDGRPVERCLSRSVYKSGNQQKLGEKRARK